MKVFHIYKIAVFFIFLSVLYPVSAETIDLRKSILNNETAYIPSQCYTKTEADDKRVHNPCYVCHTRSLEPNYINDHDLQLEYALPEPGLSNPWKNLFEDRRQRIAGISDEKILAYIRSDNYIDANGEIGIAKKLAKLPTSWDYNGNGSWDGYTPDCYFNFDHQGFDLDPQGKETGWRAFAYYPFPSTFWPTNGSTDDLLIRLKSSLRQNSDGIFDRDVYRLNLAIVEALIGRRNVAIDPVDESRFGVDIDKDGRLAMAQTVVFDWEPREGRMMSYVGLAQKELQAGKLHLAAGLFPEGTEFLHSVRYIDVNDKGQIVLANRMKELRYMKKRTWRTYSDLEESTLGEMKERDDFPDRVSQPIGNAEHGINNGDGWILQGFIENKSGQLRPQSFEETVYCIGCHGGVGATTDSVFGFPRKVDKRHYQDGWYHWSQKPMSGLQEPKIEIRGSGPFYEYSYYLMYNHSGSEFRDNPEVLGKFYNADGTVRKDMLDRLHGDISILLNPSPQRALALNKAYRTIVQDQDFHQGRDVNIGPINSVHTTVTQDQTTGVKQATNIQAFGSRFGPGCTDDSEDKISVIPAVAGKGMVGPSGIPYQADWRGIIHKSTYAIDIPGVHFTFPRRLTPPTRMIVPVGKNPACMTCHRIPYTTVPAYSESVRPLDLPRLPARSFRSAGMQRLTQSRSEDQNAIWSPDGEMIAFVSDRSGSTQIWLMAKDGSRQRQLTRGDAVHGWPQWHPDSSALVVWSYDPAAARHSIKTIDANSGEQNTLVSSTEMIDRPVFDPDGEYIAYAAETNGNWDIWLVSVADGEKIRLTTGAQMESNPLWTADGKLLSYKVAPATGVYSLTWQNFMSFENGLANPSIHQWNGPESVQMNHWSPDGSRIAYTAEVITGSSGNELVSYAAVVSDLSLDQSTATASTSRLLAKGCTLGDRGPVFSPDGNKVAFWGWHKNGTASIWLYDLRNDDLTRLTNNGIDMYPQWSPDGKRLVFETRIGSYSNLVTLNLARD